MLSTKTIELLSPAKNLECGIEAINHGADAVYIGSPRFGARAAAGNSVSDIEALVNYAHLYNAKIYVALNTILKDEELSEAEKLIHQIYNAGADALIIQDMGILELDLPPIALHASTQTDNRTPEKVKFLEEVGFSQIVLARELSLKQIEAISKQTTAKLEVFVHGALCVSYSGQCYASEAFCGRSANRGECAQYCRLPYTLQDATGKNIITEKHLLSLKDLNRSVNLEQLINAGVSSFKIEGRLKDVDYVKNITAFYRQKLDAILSEKGNNYKAASSGKCIYTFTPNPEKSFSRGFTDYFLNGQKQNLTSPDTPKSMGEFIGIVKRSERNCFAISGKKELHNGDGLCYVDKNGKFTGFRVNKVEDRKIFPFEHSNVAAGISIYRNFDKEFDKCLSAKSSERKIDLNITLSENPVGFTLSACGEDNNRASLMIPINKEKANKPQNENNVNQLGKLGNTIFNARNISIDFTQNWFIPSSILVDYRRKLIEKLMSVRKINYRREIRRKVKNIAIYPSTQLTYLGNVSNAKAEQFYQKHGVSTIALAYELSPQEDEVLMFTKYCIKYSLGWCPKESNKKENPYHEPFYLIHNNVKMKLIFDCKNCETLLKKG